MRGTKKVESAVFIDVEERFRDAYEELTTLPDMDGSFRAVAEHVGLGRPHRRGADVAAPDLSVRVSMPNGCGRSRSRTSSRSRSPRTRGWSAACSSAATVAANPTGAASSAPFGRCARTCCAPSRCACGWTVRSSAARDALAALDLVEQAVLLVDAGAAIVHANRAAEVALRGGDGMSARHSVLACDRADDTATLRRLVGEASAAPPAAPAARWRSVAAPAAGRCRSSWRRCAASARFRRGRRATAMVLVADPDTNGSASGTQLRKLYGLTAAEARTAEALLDHRRLADMAARLGVSLATVRTLLQRAFEKTGTHRQAELVRLMLAHRLPSR